MENIPTNTNYFCPICKFSVQNDWFFCPNCAHELKEKIPNITLGKQLVIYLVSFFLTPLGLGWGLKYIRSKDNKVKMIGAISILLTIISIVMMIAAFKSFAEQYGKMLNGLMPPL